MKTILNPLKLITLLLLCCPCLHSQVNVQKKDSISKKNNPSDYTTNTVSSTLKQSWMSKLKDETAVTDTFSIIEYMRNNPEDYGIVYQAYLRTRYMEGPVTKEKMDSEVATLKNEVSGNKIDYTKIAYKETTVPKKEEESKDRLTASTVVKPEKQ